MCPQAQKAALFSAGISGLEAALIFTAFFGTHRGQYWQKPRWRVFSTADRPTELVSQALSAVARFRIEFPISGQAEQKAGHDVVAITKSHLGLTMGS